MYYCMICSEKPILKLLKNVLKLFPKLKAGTRSKVLVTSDIAVCLTEQAEQDQTHLYNTDNISQ